MKLIDIGVNLTSERFDPDRAAVVARAEAAGVVHMIITGTDYPNSVDAQRLAADCPTRLSATAGIHPHQARHWQPDDAERLAELASQPEVVAIGETGLDFNRDFSPRSDQERVFEAQLELASGLGLPVFLHQRDALTRFTTLLGRYRHRLTAAVAHCFTGDREALAACLDLDLHIGITGWVCDERRGQPLKALLPDIPLSRLMIETDAPYLLPRTLRPRPKSGRNEPAYLPEVLTTIAESYRLEPTQLATLTTANAIRFFGLGDRVVS